MKGKTIAEAKKKIELKQCTNEKPKMKKSVKIALINIFQLEFGPVSALGDELGSFVLEHTLISRQNGQFLG